MTQKNGNVAIRRAKDRPGRDPRLAAAARRLLEALARRDVAEALAGTDRRALARARRALRQALREGEY
jgi:hypothetical protein